MRALTADLAASSPPQVLAFAVLTMLSCCIPKNLFSSSLCSALSSLVRNSSSFRCTNFSSSASDYCKRSPNRHQLSSFICYTVLNYRTYVIKIHDESLIVSVRLEVVLLTKVICLIQFISLLDLLASIIEQTSIRKADLNTSLYTSKYLITCSEAFI